MAESKITELARRTELDLAVLRNDVDSLQEKLTEAGLKVLSERLAVLGQEVTVSTGLDSDPLSLWDD